MFPKKLPCASDIQRNMSAQSLASGTVKIYVKDEIMLVSRGKGASGGIATRFPLSLVLL